MSCVWRHRVRLRRDSRRCWITGVAGSHVASMVHGLLVCLSVSEPSTRQETIGKLARLLDGPAVTCWPNDDRAVRCPRLHGQAGNATQRRALQCSQGAASCRVTMEVAAALGIGWPSCPSTSPAGVIVKMLQPPLPSVLQGVRHPGRLQVDHPEVRPGQSIHSTL